MTLEEVRDMVVGLLELASAKQELEARISALEGRELAGGIGERLEKIEKRIGKLEELEIVDEGRVEQMIENALDSLEAEANVDITISH